MNNLPMLSIQEHILVETIANKYTNSLLLEAEGNQCAIQDGFVMIDAKYVTIGLPIEGTTLYLNDSEIAKGKDLMSVYEKMESGDAKSAYPELMEIIKKAKEGAKEGAEEKEDDEDKVAAIKLTIEGARVYPPKCQELDVYVECNAEVAVKSDGGKDVKLEPTSLVLGKLGKVSLKLVFKLMLKCVKLYAGAFSGTLNTMVVDPENKDDKTIDDKAMEEQVSNMLQQAIKDNASDIKNADDEGEGDETVKSELDKEALSEIIAAAK